MFIKEVVLCGFKSYRERTRIQNLDPGYNVVVGRNGSGKSNFFAALEFALRSDTKALRREERKALLYNGGVGIDFAYVEVVFDNADRKLPYNTDIVTFKRLVGAKKDKFLVNNKEGHNVKDFLDSAGISNPYYVVKQGKINEMASMTEKARLQLLYDISGSKAYDEQKIKAKKRVQDCENKMKKVNEMVESSNKRLDDLTERFEELECYEKLEKKKRAVDYLVHNREKFNIISKNEKLQRTHDQLIELCEPAQQEVLNLRQNLEEIDEKLSNIEQQVSFYTSKKKDVDTEFPVTLAQMASIENQLKDSNNNWEIALNSEKNIEKLEQQIKAAEVEVEILDQQTSKLKKEEGFKQDRYISSKTELENLKDKCGRAAQFTSKSKRDEWIKSEIQKLDLLLHEQNSSMKNHDKSLADIQEEFNDLNNKLEESKENLELHRNKIIELESSTVATDYNILVQKRRELWNEVNKIDQELNLTNVIFERIMNDLRKSCGNTHVYGWQSVQTVLKNLQGTKLEHIVNGYHGLVLQNISCEPDLHTAVEAGAGVKLMYHIVDSHEVSKAIMREFNKSKLNGELNFIPLYEIKEIDRRHSTEQQNCSPLIQHISFDPKFSKAIKYVFGETMLCASLETASYVAKNCGMNCVTLDGDKVLRKGPMSGGYYNRQSSKLETWRKLIEQKERIQKYTTDNDAVQKKLHEIEQDIVNCNSKKEKLESQLCALRIIYEKVQIEKALLERNTHYSKSKLQQEALTMENLKTAVKNYILQKEKLEEELTEKMSEKTSHNMKRLKILKASLEQKQMEAKNITEVREKKENEKKLVEKSIKKMEKEIEQLKLLGSTSNAINKMRDDLAGQLRDLQDIKRKQESEWNNVTDQLTAFQKEMNEMLSVKDRTLESVTEKKSKLDKITKELEKIFQIQSEEGKSLANVRAAMIKLGTVPAEVKKYEGKSTKDLCKILAGISESMLKFGKINRRAAEKLEKAKKIKEELGEVRNKYIKRIAKISALDKTLDEKKGEAVFNIFTSIHHEFRKIFIKLIPKGDVRMFLRTTSGGQIDGVTVGPGAGSKVFDMFRENKFEGLAIDVNFLGKQMVNCQDVRSLSGGQKSLLSLALLLAIQKCDPVPLYIFDEVDQALDKKHRSAVAALIKEMSKTAQFVCTTFSRQFIDKSDAAFGVCFQNQASKLLSITVEKARAFVENDSDSTFEESESCANISTRKSIDYNMDLEALEECQ